MSEVRSERKVRPGIESLLRPILVLSARDGGVRLKDLLPALRRMRLLAGASADDVMNILSEAGQTAVQAAMALRESGLVISGVDGTLLASPAGLELTRDHEAVTFEVLGRRPAYRQYLERLKREKNRRDWQVLRFDFYAAGRRAAVHGSAHAAPTLLAYSIEYSLKAALAELGPNLVTKRERNSHDLGALYHLCLDRGLFRSTYVADDFLDYVQRHFERRYPRGQERLLEERRYWAFGRACLSTFDDCVVQLERGLDELYGSSEWSLGSYALSAFGSGEAGLAFFYCNPFALSRLPEYRASVPTHHVAGFWGDRLERPEVLFCALGEFPYPPLLLKVAQELLNLDLAAKFVYPRASEPDPDPVRVKIASAGTRNTLSSRHSWIPRRLEEVFGRHSVEVVEDRESRTVGIFVFDRAAKQYWAMLRVDRFSPPFVVQNEHAKQVLENWIAGAEAKFASEKRQLRLPPESRSASEENSS